MGPLKKTMHTAASHSLDSTSILSVKPEEDDALSWFT